MTPLYYEIYMLYLEKGYAPNQAAEIARAYIAKREAEKWK